MNIHLNEIIVNMGYAMRFWCIKQIKQNWTKEYACLGVLSTCSKHHKWFQSGITTHTHTDQPVFDSFSFKKGWVGNLFRNGSHQLSSVTFPGAVSNIQHTKVLEEMALLFYVVLCLSVWTGFCQSKWIFSVVIFTICRVSEYVFLWIVKVINIQDYLSIYLSFSYAS